MADLLAFCKAVGWWIAGALVAVIVALYFAYRSEDRYIVDEVYVFILFFGSIFVICVVLYGIVFIHDRIVARRHEVEMRRSEQEEQSHTRK